MSAGTITPSDNGPYVVEGGAMLVDEEGNRYQVGDTVALCRCGLSSSKPFCDGSHEQANFAAADRAAAAFA